MIEINRRFFGGYRRPGELYHVCVVQDADGAYQELEHDDIWIADRLCPHGCRGNMAVVRSFRHLRSLPNSDVTNVFVIRPLLTLTFLLLLPSFMTIITLIIHRFRQARAERRERAPESVVASLPIGTWSGEGVVFDGEGGVEKDGDHHHHESETEGEGEGDSHADASETAASVASRPVLVPSATDSSEASTSSSYVPQVVISVPASIDDRAEEPGSPSTARPATLPPSSPSNPNSTNSKPLPTSPPTVAAAGPASQRTKYLKKAWFASQTECAICLGDFEKGDRLRILPCGHLFHLDEVDVWLIRRKKLVSSPREEDCPLMTLIVNLFRLTLL